MELKRYQKQIIADLSRYLDCLNETRSLPGAYRKFWNDIGVGVGYGGLPPYQDILPGVPNICAKVPTGGGKTLIACHALRPIFDALPSTKARVVVWLVPSDAILTQTLAALRNPSHPYRQAIDADFGNRVEVYTKDQLLTGQNFNPVSVTEQLSVCVLSYDSFRGRRESLKAKRENSALSAFADVLGKPESPIEDADETALLQIINQLSPLVIVDESHHAKSTLSMEMLRNFNPRFVLELTATPKKESNVFCYVDAAQLKRESMVKLPVIVYNRDSQTQVLTDAIDLRRKLEELAERERETSGRYIRPIVLFQAQPRVKENSATFEKLREKLKEAGIPANQIAIRTADVNELKSVNLMGADCPIRFIITVNALKEGWDCPFAYVLASLANRTSRVDVEQILGRVLRLPHTRRNQIPALNMSYVLTSSGDFQSTLDNIVAGLNNAGFSGKDYRAVSDTETATPPQSTPEVQTEIPQEPQHDEGEDFLNFNPQSVSHEVEQRQAGEKSGDVAETMLKDAEKTGQEYERVVSGQAENASGENLSWEVTEKMSAFQVNPEFADEIRALKIPQFFLTVPDSLFANGNDTLLRKETLSEGFTLKGKSTEIDFSDADAEMAMVDVQDKSGSVPKAFKMSDADQRYFKEYFSRFPAKERVEKCGQMIFHQLNRMNLVDAGELKRYLGIILGDMNPDQLAALEKSPMSYARKIREKIESLLEEHYAKQFGYWLETGRIICRESYSMPLEIHPLNSVSSIGKSLYAAEEEMNGLERELVMELTALSNVRWWHRNIARRGFCINGFLNHYPDIMIMTEKGTVVFAETKGDHLKNDDSRQKVKLGRTWQNEAGKKYRYYMVFRDTDAPIDGAVNMSGFLDILRNL